MQAGLLVPSDSQVTEDTSWQALFPQKQNCITEFPEAHVRDWPRTPTAFKLGA
jgi:hypothetical protein